MTNQIEYRVRPVTRFIVTRYETERPVDGRASNGSSTQHGEFDNEDTAYAVGYALAKAESDRLGLPPGDMAVMFPPMPGLAASCSAPLQVDGWPRRSRVDYWSPAEHAISAAMRAVEEAGGSLKLTEAVNLLAKAQACVADHIESQPDPLRFKASA